MSGWLLIIFLLILGGLISTFGDLLGTKIGKARFSILKLRPRRTATLITIITGSLISASSLSLMILVNRQLRVGLFRLGDLQRKLQESRQVLVPLKKEREALEKTIINKEVELKQLEQNVIALRSGQFVISSGQSLIIYEINSDSVTDFDARINSIIKNANRLTQKIVIPNSKVPKNVLYLRRNHIEELKNTISQGGEWIINIKSVTNVLKGEQYVYAFPEVIRNKVITLKGEIISKTFVSGKDLNNKTINNEINLLLASTLAEIKRRGSLINEIKLRSDSVKELRDFINKNRVIDLELKAISLRNSKTAQPVIVDLKFESNKEVKLFKQRKFLK
ncbi:MAG: hypothetical protein CMK49_00495 [Prochlorococcus sp. SP3034]|nr:hypothetical protein [Prochlorococcus sp. SP3034]